MSASSTTLPRSTPAAPTPCGGDERLHVVLVDEELPYPANSGKRIRTLNLTQRLARRHRLTYVCHRNADAAEAKQAAAYFAEQGIRTIVVDRAVPPRCGLRFYFRLAANLFSPLPYSVASHRSRALRRALRRLAATDPVDLWHCEWTPYLEALRGLAGPRVVVAHNVESVLWRRYAEAEVHPLRRWYICRQWHKYERFERRALASVDRTIAVSDLDADRLREDFGVPQVEVVENGVDTAHFRPRCTPRDPARLLFLGSLDWRPNLDGVSQLLDHVFPVLQSHLPQASLWLVGRNPPEWLRQRVAVTPGVELHADVADVVPFLGSCGLMVVPLRIGGGSRLKILEALACGTPVVSTRIGAEGLSLQPGQHLGVVEEVNDLVPALAAAIQDPLAAQQQAQRGREVVLARYDWNALADRMDTVWRSVVPRRTQTRQGAA